MSLLCFSLAATLRCAGIPNTQSIILLVPPAIEALQSLFLIRTVWRNGRKRWLLAVEAWMFLLLAILDYASHATVRGMWSVGVFEPMDKAIGVLSGIPILTYMSFLFLLARADILPLITPNTLRTLFQFALFSLIPPTLMSHELGSLVGVSYRLNPVTLVPETGFLSLTTRSLSFAFTTSAIVCLASFQLLIFLVCTWRISQAWDRTHEPVFVAATRPRSGSRSTRTSYLGEEPGIRGLSWLALALALGATETLLSLGSQSFALVLARRILLVFSRASLMYALVRGSSDGFSNLEAAGNNSVDKRASTFIQPTPGGLGSNPFADPGPASGTPRSRVTVQYDLKSAPESLDEHAYVCPTNTSTSVAGHGGHSTVSRSRTLSEKRSVPPLASIQVPERVFLAGVVATQTPSSTRGSLPSLPSQSQSRLALGSLNRSTSQIDHSTSSHLGHSTSSHPHPSSRRSTNEDPGSYEPRTSLDGVRELASQFPGVPIRRAPTQLAYAVEEEDEPGSSQRASNSETSSRHARTQTAESNFSALTGASLTTRRKPVPAHTPGGTIIDLPSTNRSQLNLSSSGEQVVLDAHRGFFPQPGPYEFMSSRASSDETDTLTGTPSPAEIITRRPVLLAERARAADEHSWMMRASLPMNQNVVSRTPEVLDTADFESSRVELDGAASPRSAWSAQAPWVTRSRRSTLRPGSNVEGWGRKLSDSDPSLVPAHLRPEPVGPSSSSRPDELIRQSMISTRTRHQSGSFVGDEPHAI
ncbi:hypothetical protein RSOLAG22IIIB_05026 [Rhizoctonia solani]|uniref:Uncharacterized protein n=1 Tax=Rhizoctonia solani TaxID=456999 RepID=A0A0K6G3D3_9AGAM|nr:hypothetical protein RSOLAG22IIIB_05026 [Rhizoctonia solani]